MLLLRLLLYFFELAPDAYDIGKVRSKTGPGQVRESDRGDAYRCIPVPLAFQAL